MHESSVSKTLRSKELGVYRGVCYYTPIKPEKDWIVKCQIEEVLREHPSYGSRRVAIHLQMNRKKVKRVMNLFGIKAYRRRGKKWKKSRNIKVIYPNMLMTHYPTHPNHIWTADFTHLSFKAKEIYIATNMDLYTRRIVGVAVYTNHAVELVLSAFMNGIYAHPRPEIFHSDNGSEYNAEIFIDALQTLNIQISRSQPGCPWENGYQESFHSQFKVDFGDPARYTTLGELVYAIYQTIYIYNNTRIHSALKMSPNEFAKKLSSAYNI